MKRLNGREPLEEIITLIATEEQVYLSAAAMSLILEVVVKRQHSAEVIQQLADSLECESVEYEDRKSGVIAQSLFELSSPEINGMPTNARCLELIAALKATGSTHPVPRA